MIFWVLLGGVLSVPFLTYADTTPNLVANPGLENTNPHDVAFPEHWSTGFWGTSNAVFSYPIFGVDDTKAAKVEIAQMAAGTNGDAKWFFGDVSVHPREQYIFSDYYIANVPPDAVARYTLLDGGYKYVYLGTSITSPTWTGYATLPFTVPEGAVSLTVFHLIHEAGSLAIDNVSLRRLAGVQEPPPLVPSLKVPTANPDGGAVPLSYLSRTITGTLSAPIKPSVPKAITRAVTPSTAKTPTIVAAVLEKINNKDALTYVRHPKAANDIGITSFIRPVEAAAETPSNFSPKTNGVAPLGMLADGFPDLALALSGLLLILFSLGVTFLLTSSQNRKRGR
jgi:hypothetical protein